MKRGTIIILFLSLAITIVTVLAYFSKRNQFIMNKFVIVIIKSFYFNNIPVISISFLAIGEYLIWETQNNSDAMAVKNKITERMRLLSGTIQLYLMSMPKRNIPTLKEFVSHLQLLHIEELRLK